MLVHQLSSYLVSRARELAPTKPLDVVKKMEAIVDLMATNRQFNDAIQLSTSSIDNVKLRFDIMRQTVEGVLRDHVIQPRCSSRELKQELFDKSPACQICHQTIQQLDDAAVDHIEQYWRGGKTILENARLAHRYCNGARPRHD
jgi:hypothetical protein